MNEVSKFHKIPKMADVMNFVRTKHCELNFGSFMQKVSVHLHVASRISYTFMPHYPFNCQFVVKQQQKSWQFRHFGGDGSCIIHQMDTIDHSWLREKRRKECVCARGKKDFFFYKGCDQCHCVY